jgi:hypothetical protein
MKNSRTIEQILKEIRENYREERRAAAPSSADAKDTIIPFRTRDPDPETSKETRWNTADLTVVWRSPDDQS